MAIPIFDRLENNLLTFFEMEQTSHVFKDAGNNILQFSNGNKKHQRIAWLNGSKAFEFDIDTRGIALYDIQKTRLILNILETKPVRMD